MRINRNKLKINYCLISISVNLVKNYYFITYIQLIQIDNL